LTTLKYVQPASAMSQDEGGLVTTTVKDYDLQETAKAMKGLFTVSYWDVVRLDGYLVRSQE
jgi:hypothetical protein